LFAFDDGRGLFILVDETDQGYWSTYDRGNVFCGAQSVMDITGEWRDPAKIQVGMYRHKITGQIRVWDEISRAGWRSPVDYWELVEIWMLTEGEGNGQ
jgi:hypothetical protein